MARRSKSLHIFEERVQKNNRENNINFIKGNKRLQITYEKQKSFVKLVPPFSVQSTQKNTEVFTLPCKYAKSSKIKNMDDVTKKMVNRFKTAYLDRQIPLQIIDGIKKKTILWNISLKEMDIMTINKLIRIVTLGLPCSESPYETIALEAFDSLLCLPGTEYIIFQVLTEVVTAIRKALDYGNNEKKIKILSIIIKMTKIRHIGISLVPYYKQLLSPLRQPYSKISFSNEKANKKNDSNYHLSQYIHKTLVALEESGGKNALVNIRYAIPHYQSIFYYQ
uniref:Parkin co-regulated protein n=1 Tax=Strongyloides venezuelensis TaxID=75913 RepID=A0A0K0EX36_STRVS